MASLASPPTTAPLGSYVVPGPARTDTIGDILRASFVPGKSETDDLNRLLARIDNELRAF